MPRNSSGCLTVVYPPGCREISEDIGTDELVRRLKTLTAAFQSMNQDDESYKDYTALAIHLADDFFLTHESGDVKLMIACCLADVLRVFAPDAPYKDPRQIQYIMDFLVDQLQGLRDLKDPCFKRYFYLLENVAYVKSFNMCLDLENNQEIFCHLFETFFRIVQTDHAKLVKNLMVDIMLPLVTDADAVSDELLEKIFINLINGPPTKPNYELAQDLVQKAEDGLANYIQTYLTKALIMEDSVQEKRMDNAINERLFDLIYNLHQIIPDKINPVLPHLEYKIKAVKESDRMGAVTLLAKMFSGKDGTVLAGKHPQLWTAFLGRFKDINPNIRIKCVQHSMHLLLNHPDLRADVTEKLASRQRDLDEAVRYETVLAVVQTAKKDVSIVLHHQDLLMGVKERTLDKKFKIRKEALMGLGSIYRQYTEQGTKPPPKSLDWIKDKILHLYYMPDMEDRCLIESLLNSSLVPYKLPAKERMVRLFYLYATADENATRSFMEILKNQMFARKATSELLNLITCQTLDGQEEELRQKQLNAKTLRLSKQLPDHVKSSEYLMTFVDDLSKRRKIRQLMEIILDPDVKCKDCADAIMNLLRQMGAPVMTNLYYNTVRKLSERISSVMVDQESLLMLILLVKDSILSPDTPQKLGIPPIDAGVKGVKLLLALSYTQPAHFCSVETIRQLMSFFDLPHKDAVITPHILVILKNISGFKQMETEYPPEYEQLKARCVAFMTDGDAKEGKTAVKCLFAHSLAASREVTFGEVLENMKNHMEVGDPKFRSCIVSLGHIALLLPESFKAIIRNIVTRKVIKGLFFVEEKVKWTPPGDENGELSWVAEEELPEQTRCKLEGMKLIARWLVGLKHEESVETVAERTFRMFNAFIIKRGDLLEKKVISKPEMSWLRLYAGVSMLKICEQKGVGDVFTAGQLINLSVLMMDEVPEVRERFLMKVHKGLSRPIPISLPLDFLSLYAKLGKEPDKRIKNMGKGFMVADMKKRREHIRYLELKAGSTPAAKEKFKLHVPHLLPDYVLAFAIPLIARDPEFTDHSDVEQLKVAHSCLMFIMEPLLVKNEYFSYKFFSDLIQSMKNSFFYPESPDPNTETNKKIYALCDMAAYILVSKVTAYEGSSGSMGEPIIPRLFFKGSSDPNYSNINSYLPKEIQAMLERKPTVMSSAALNQSRAGRSRKKPEEQHILELEEEESAEDGEAGGAPPPRGRPQRAAAAKQNNQLVEEHEEEEEEDDDDEVQLSPAVKRASTKFTGHKDGISEEISSSDGGAGVESGLRTVTARAAKRNQLEAAPPAEDEEIGEPTSRVRRGRHGVAGAGPDEATDTSSSSWSVTEAIRRSAGGRKRTAKAGEGEPGEGPPVLVPPAKRTRGGKRGEEAESEDSVQQMEEDEDDAEPPVLTPEVGESAEEQVVVGSKSKANGRGGKAPGVSPSGGKAPGVSPRGGVEKTRREKFATAPVTRTSRSSSASASRSSSTRRGK